MLIYNQEEKKPYLVLRVMFHDVFVSPGSPRATTEVEAKTKNAKNLGISSRFPTDGANCGVQNFGSPHKINSKLHSSSLREI